MSKVLLCPMTGTKVPIAPDLLRRKWPNGQRVFQQEIAGALKGLWTIIPLYKALGLAWFPWGIWGLADGRWHLFQGLISFGGDLVALGWFIPAKQLCVEPKPHRPHSLTNECLLVHSRKTWCATPLWILLVMVAWLPSVTDDQCWDLIIVWMLPLSGTGGGGVLAGPIFNHDCCHPKPVAKLTIDPHDLWNQPFWRVTQQRRVAGDWG